MARGGSAVRPGALRCSPTIPPSSRERRGTVFLSGWVGLLANRITNQPTPDSLNDYLTGGELPRLVLPLLIVVALRAVAGGWRDAGFAPNLRGAGAT